MSTDARIAVIQRDLAKFTGRIGTWEHDINFLIDCVAAEKKRADDSEQALKDLLSRDRQDLTAAQEEAARKCANLVLTTLVVSGDQYGVYTSPSIDGQELAEAIYNHFSITPEEPQKWTTESSTSGSSRTAGGA